MLCFRVAQLLSRSNYVALMSAAMFATAARTVEAVAWISAIAEPLSTIFELGALTLPSRAQAEDYLARTDRRVASLRMRAADARERLAVSDNRGRLRPVDRRLR